jgi:hypothetical protein
MAKQTFTTGQVLTAAQMTSLQANDYNWTVSAQTANYVLVASNAGQHITMNSASATTITVNTSLFTAGDTLRITNIGAGTSTITAGTATVTSAGPLALVQWASGILYFTSASAAIFFPDAKNTTVGMTLIKTQTIGSAVSSVNVTSAFSATYDNYYITVNGGVASGDINMGLTLGAAATGYYASRLYILYSSATVTGDVLSNASNYGTVVRGSTNTLNGAFSLFDPFNTKNTTLLCGMVGASTGSFWQSGGGYLANTTSYSDFTLTCGTGNVTGGTIRVYGYSNS